MAQDPPEERFIQIEQVKKNFPLEGVVSRRVYGDTVAVYIVDIEKGAVSNDHLHADEQVMIMDSGLARAYVADRTHVLRPGDVLIGPSNVPHHFEALEDSTWKEVHGPGFIRRE